MDDVLEQIQALEQPSSTATDIERAERDAIAAQRATIRALVAACFVSLLVGAAGVWLGVRGGMAVESLCEQQVDARLELARIKERRAPLIVGANAAERRDTVLAEAAALRRTAARAQCSERYRLP
ncbi:MAG: hypothetical protein PGN13_16395 [Patulibacter minatonensis]